MGFEYAHGGPECKCDDRGENPECIHHGHVPRIAHLESLLETCKMSGGTWKMRALSAEHELAKYALREKNNAERRAELARSERTLQDYRQSEMRKLVHKP